ncbi:hypothetical protein [Mycolicibacterium smegmatis]|nr:hypothetical protein [Mycolicibacterium smegmatis]MDF1899012.1 hypothetical protein [Mycolicibacterium smegmatis]MDF1904836.1 hypothetical protein [Mycolicibacterium smegmatis]MDF1918705.1 hypothetical protein [Mycolicibacterium smegmatis]MDF1924000.1 hypothetical protein [Mycolicibacterium smegmatis]UUR97446.1 hypothetical protein NQ424_05500 [Mycolicibacterium smegmatis]
MRTVFSKRGGGLRAAGAAVADRSVPVSVTSIIRARAHAEFS